MTDKNRYFNNRMISSYETYANPRHVAIPSTPHGKIMVLLGVAAVAVGIMMILADAYSMALKVSEQIPIIRTTQIRGETLPTRRVTGAD